MGRPSEYCEEIALEIAALCSEGQSMKTICAGRGMPSLRTIWRWRASHPEFDGMLVRALVDKADLLFEESISISDEEVTGNDQASRQRTRVQARQWAAARLNPAKYSEKLGLGQAQGLQPLQPDPWADLPEPQRKLELARHILFIFAQADHALREQEEAERQANAPRLAYSRTGND